MLNKQIILLDRLLSVNGNITSVAFFRGGSADVLPVIIDVMANVYFNGYLIAKKMTAENLLER